MKPMSIQVGLKGRYKMQVRRADGSVRIETPWFDNLILTSGLNRIGTGAIGTHCHVGSGSANALITDTALQSFIGSTNTIHASSTDGQQATAPYFGWVRNVYRFAPGQATGNVSEVGIGWSATTGDLFSRALVRDELGDPLTITILPEEFLDVTYELRIYPPTADIPFSAVIGGVTYTGVARASNVDTVWDTVDLLLGFGSEYAGGINSFAVYDGPIGSVTQVPSGAVAYPASTPTLDAYSNNSYTRVFTATFNLTDGNLVGGIGACSFAWYGLGSFQFSFDPKIPKDDTKTMTLRGSISWARKTL